MNKKGNVIYVMMVFVVIIVLFGFFSLIGYKIIDEVKDPILEDINMTEAREVLNDTHDRYPPVFDSVILIVFVGVWIAGIGSVFMKDEHPMIFGLMMIAVAFVIIGGMWLANSWEEFTQDTDYSTLVTSFPYTFFIITHMVELSIGIAVSIILVLYAKNRL